MGTGNDSETKKNGQHAPKLGDLKTGKGSARYQDEGEHTAQQGKGNPQQSSPGNDPRQFSDKMDETGQPDVGTKSGRKS